MLQHPIKPEDIESLLNAMGVTLQEVHCTKVECEIATGHPPLMIVLPMPDLRLDGIPVTFAPVPQVGYVPYQRRVRC